MALPIEDMHYPAVLKDQKNGQLDDDILFRIECPGGGYGLLVEPAFRAFRAMFADALNAGIRFMFTSVADSYRPYSVQRAVFLDRYYRVPTNAGIWWDGSWWRKKADEATAAIPGTSNHGWGLAGDLAEQRDSDSAPEDLSDRAVNWLIANAHLYGISAELESEKWHWRKYDGDSITPAILAYEGKGDGDTMRIKFDSSWSDRPAELGDRTIVTDRLGIWKVEALDAPQEGAPAVGVISKAKYPKLTFSQAFSKVTGGAAWSSRLQGIADWRQPTVTVTPPPAPAPLVVVPDHKHEPGGVVASAPTVTVTLSQ